MSNIKAKRANYCEGGNFMYTANYVNLYFSTLEKELNFKYDYDNYKYKWDQGIIVQPIISSQNYIKPFQTFESQDPQYEIPQQTPVICVHCSINPAKKQDIWRIKSYLSRGIALTSALTVNESQDMFNTYDGISVLHKRCDEFKNDHQVTLVGYGYKNGQEVWMLNSNSCLILGVRIGALMVTFLFRQEKIHFALNTYSQRFYRLGQVQINQFMKIQAVKQEEHNMNLTAIIINQQNSKIAHGQCPFLLFVSSLLLLYALEQLYIRESKRNRNNMKPSQ
ncbi:Cathepsin_L [Hexamita inflata]|uniref:Cathepsin L n=1 Tax=Hexamita inflata TaxID=28002 RepID=A0AA86NXI2_9EUKA|nr:Cathepsin L [Hexamita inflata]